MNGKTLGFILFLILCFASCFLDDNSNRKHHYTFSEKYSGVVFIEFGKSEQPPLLMNDSIMLIKVPSNGLVETSTAYNDFAEFSNQSVISWENFSGVNNNDLRNMTYGYFQTKENFKVDTIINANGEKRFVRNRTAKDFNYVCFYVNYDTSVINWDSLISNEIKEKKDCNSIIERRTYRAY